MREKVGQLRRKDVHGAEEVFRTPRSPRIAREGETRCRALVAGPDVVDDVVYELLGKSSYCRHCV